MTSRTGHRRPPLQRTSASGRILSAGLATATCIGVVGLLGARTIDANAESNSEQADSVAQADASVVSEDAASWQEPTTSSGLTEADLDAYAAALAKEKQRLDDYRAKLRKTAKKLTRQAARLQAAANASSTSQSVGATSSSTTSGQSARPAASAAKKPQSAPQQQAKPVAKPAPAAKPAPKQQAAPQQQSTSKGS